MSAYIGLQALAGNVFIGSTAGAGVDPPAFNATAQVFGLWNPAGSGVNCVLDRIIVGQADATTPAISGLSISYLPNAGSAIGAAGAPITAFTGATPVNSRLGYGNASRTRFTPSAATTIATTFLMSIGLSQDSVTPGTGLVTSVFDFDGVVIVPQGVAVFLTGAPAAIGQLLTATLTWAEIVA